MKFIKSLMNKFKGLSKIMKTIVVIVLIPVVFFGGVVVYGTSIVLIDTVFGTDISKTVNNEEYQVEQERLKVEKEEEKKKETLAIKEKEEQEGIKKEKINKEKEETNKEDSKKTTSNTNTEKEKTLIDEIVLGEGHPTYYGSLEDAKKYAKKVSKKKVIVEGEYNDNAVLTIDGYDEIIRNIEIYPKNINQKLTEEKAIKIVNSYLPKEILRKYYGEPEYETYVPEDSSENTYKVINYGLTEEGSDAYYDKKHNYQGQVTVIIEEDKDGVYGIYIRFGTPRWMSSASTNGYKVGEWSIN